ncbi:MAG: hypothetical protein ACRDN9_01390 [Streptosporangiaceae bacterium]
MAEGSRPRLSVTQIVASATAATSGAVAASYLGVYGTLMGAALMSVISTGGTVVYEHYFHRARGGLRRVRARSTRHVPSTSDTGPTSGTRLGSRASRRRPAMWRAAAAGAAVVFVVAITGVSFAELLAGTTMSDVVGGQRRASGTSVSMAVTHIARPDPGRRMTPVGHVSTRSPTADHGHSASPTTSPTPAPTHDGKPRQQAPTPTPTETTTSSPDASPSPTDTASASSTPAPDRTSGSGEPHRTGGDSAGSGSTDQSSP